MTRENYRKRTAALAAALVAAAAMVLTGADGPARAALPGSTGAIAFVATRDGGNDIYRMNGDGFGQTRLTETPGFNQDPAWSADGERIVFGNRNWDDLFQMKADGSEERKLTNTDGLDFAASYYPSGDKVAFSSYRDEGNQQDVYTMTLSSTGQITGLTRITTSGADDQSAVISPDGKRMAFASDRDGGDFDLYLMRAAPEGPKNRPVKITRSPADDGRPAWSPDGRKVAFTSYRPGSGGSIDADVWRMRARDGANPANLTDNAAALDFDPEWQPVP